MTNTDTPTQSSARRAIEAHREAADILTVALETAGKKLRSERRGDDYRFWVREAKAPRAALLRAEAKIAEGRVWLEEAGELSDKDETLLRWAGIDYFEAAEETIELIGIMVQKGKSARAHFDAGTLPQERF